MASSIKLLGRRAGGDPGPTNEKKGYTRAPRNAQRTIVALLPLPFADRSATRREMHTLQLAILTAALPGVHAPGQPQQGYSQSRARR